MASSIDATKPTAGAALTADVRNNFSAAKTEIEALQAAVASALVAKAGDTMTGALNWAATQTIASAATTDIGAATSNSVIVSGTTTITGLGTIAAGAERVVQFSGALTLTHNATSLILPGGASITTAAGDVAYFVSLGSGNWRCTGYQKANGQAIVASGTTPGGASGDVQTNNGAGALAGSSSFNWSSTSNTLTIAGGTRTTSGSTLNITETRNAAGVTFPGALVINTTETASASGSLIADFRASSASKFAIRKDGKILVPDNGYNGSGAGLFAAASTTTGIGVGNEGGNPAVSIFTNNTAIARINSTGPVFANLRLSIAGDVANTAVRMYASAAGTMEIDTGTTGTFRDLKLRNLIATGNIARGIVAKTASYTVTANDGVIECDATSAAITLTLPAVASATPGATYTLKKTDSSGNAVIWDGNASETIDGATTVQTTTQWASITVMPNAARTAWLTIKD